MFPIDRNTEAKAVYLPEARRRRRRRRQRKERESMRDIKLNFTTILPHAFKLDLKEIKVQELQFMCTLNIRTSGENVILVSCFCL